MLGKGTLYHLLMCEARGAPFLLVMCKACNIGGCDEEDDF